MSFATGVLGDASVSYTQVFVDGSKWIDYLIPMIKIMKGGEVE